MKLKILSLVLIGLFIAGDSTAMQKKDLMTLNEAVKTGKDTSVILGKIFSCLKTTNTKKSPLEKDFNQAVPILEQASRECEPKVLEIIISYVYPKYQGTYSNDEAAKKLLLIGFKQKKLESFKVIYEKVGKNASSDTNNALLTASSRDQLKDWLIYLNSKGLKLNPEHMKSQGFKNLLAAAVTNKDNFNELVNLLDEKCNLKELPELMTQAIEAKNTDVIEVLINKGVEIAPQLASSFINKEINITPTIFNTRAFDALILTYIKDKNLEILERIVALLDKECKLIDVPNVLKEAVDTKSLETLEYLKTQGVEITPEVMKSKDFEEMVLSSISDLNLLKRYVALLDKNCKLADLTQLLPTVVATKNLETLEYLKEQGVEITPSAMKSEPFTEMILSSINDLNLLKRHVALLDKNCKLADITQLLPTVVATKNLETFEYLKTQGVEITPEFMKSKDFEEMILSSINDLGLLKRHVALLDDKCKLADITQLLPKVLESKNTDALEFLASKAIKITPDLLNTCKELFVEKMADEKAFITLINALDDRCQLTTIPKLATAMDSKNIKVIDLLLSKGFTISEKQIKALIQDNIKLSNEIMKSKEFVEMLTNSTEKIEEFKKLIEALDENCNLSDACTKPYLKVIGEKYRHNSYKNDDIIKYLLEKGVLSQEVVNDGFWKLIGEEYVESFINLIVKKKLQFSENLAKDGDFIDYLIKQAENNNKKTFEDIVATHNILSNAMYKPYTYNSSYKSPLSTAINKKHDELAKYLIQNGALSQKLFDDSYYTKDDDILWPSIVEQIKDKKLTINKDSHTRHKDKMTNYLIDCVKRNNSKMLQSLHEAGLDFSIFYEKKRGNNSCYYNVNSPLLEAFKSNKYQLFKALVDYGSLTPENHFEILEEGLDWKDKVRVVDCLDSYNSFYTAKLNFLKKSKFMTYVADDAIGSYSSEIKLDLLKKMNLLKIDLKGFYAGKYGIDNPFIELLERHGIKNSDYQNCYRNRNNNLYYAYQLLPSPNICDEPVDGDHDAMARKIHEYVKNNESNSNNYGDKLYKLKILMMCGLKGYTGRIVKNYSDSYSFYHPMLSALEVGLESENYKYLVENYFKLPSLKDSSHCTNVMNLYTKAIVEEDKSMIELLEKAEFDITKAYHVLKYYGYSRSKYREKRDSLIYSTFLDAIALNKVEYVRSMLNKGALCEDILKNGMDVIFMDANDEIFNLIKGDKNFKLIGEQTRLFEYDDNDSAWFSTLTSLKRGIQLGVDLNRHVRCDGWSMMPLQAVARKKENTDHVKQLVFAGADLHKSREYILEAAQKSGDTVTINFLDKISQKVIYPFKAHRDDKLSGYDFLTQNTRKINMEKDTDILKTTAALTGHVIMKGESSPYEFSEQKANANQKRIYVDSLKVMAKVGSNDVMEHLLGRHKQSVLNDGIKLHRLIATLIYDMAEGFYHQKNTFGSYAQLSHLVKDEKDFEDKKLLVRKIYGPMLGLRSSTNNHKDLLN